MTDLLPYETRQPENAVRALSVPTLQWLDRAIRLYALVSWRSWDRREARIWRAVIRSELEARGIVAKEATDA